MSAFGKRYLRIAVVGADRRDVHDAVNAARMGRLFRLVDGRDDSALLYPHCGRWRTDSAADPIRVLYARGSDGLLRRTAIESGGAFRFPDIHRDGQAKTDRAGPLEAA